VDAGAAALDNRCFGTWRALEKNWGVYMGTWPGTNPEDEPVICDLPVGNGYPTVELFRAVRDGKIKVMTIVGENPAVSNANALLIREALEKCDFLVVQELFETETAHYADLLLPGTTQVERGGSITNSGRWVQWRYKAVDPPALCKPEPEFLDRLYKELRGSGATRLPSEFYENEHDVSIPDNDPDAEWNYGSPAVNDMVYPEMCAANVLYGKGYDTSPEYANVGGILAKRRDARPTSPEDAKFGWFKNWAWSWMFNWRVLYDREREGAKFITWWATDFPDWLGRPFYGAFGTDKACIWSEKLKKVAGISEHNEPAESPDEQLASQYPTLWRQEITDRLKRSYFDVSVGSSQQYPHVLTTFRLTEHMQAGALTRNLPYLVELHPEVFVEISPSLASELGVSGGEYVQVKTARNLNGVKVKALVTERMQPLVINGKKTEMVAMPWHWGFKGLSTGPSANTLTIDAVDVHANIPETKACLCSVEKAQEV